MDGNFAVRGWMSGAGWMSGGQGPDVRARDPWTNSMDSAGKRSIPGQNSGDFVDGNCGDDGGKLDPHKAKQIHGSNTTKLHHINKSQKKLGDIFGGDFRI